MAGIWPNAAGERTRMKREALCLGGPLDGKMRRWEGRCLAVTQFVDLPILLDRARDPIESITYVYYNRVLTADGEPLWLCDES
jgi:hypothetical protein